MKKRRVNWNQKNNIEFVEIRNSQEGELEEIWDEEELDEEYEAGMIARENRILTILRVVIFALVPVILFYLMESYEHNAFEEVRPLAQWYNILLFELIAWLLFFITGSGKAALRIETVIALVYGLVNYYVMAFRSTPFVPWDIFSVGTAASVAGNYDFTPSQETIYVTVAFLVLFLLLGFVKLKFPYGIFMRVIPVFCVGTILCVFVNLLWDNSFQSKSYLYPHLFTPGFMTKVNGMAVTFAMDLEYIYVEKPKNYTPGTAEKILNKYETTETEIEEKPNIIVVMNEAFSDLSVFGDFTTNEDYMPFIHSLQNGAENTITGNLEVSVCGGNTANTEFEFLTGHTMDYFPVGSIPYQQYMTGELPSVANQLQDMGYSTYAMHPYGAKGWSRDKVYPWLGFEKSFFLNDFSNRMYIRDYVSDKTAYEKIVETYEEKESGKPIFIFEVTMQNHGGYSDHYPNFTNTIDVEGTDNSALEQYLTLIQISDAEFQKLTEYFAKEEEKTILLFFGDHQPNDSVANQVLTLNGILSSEMTEEEAKLRYQVPYVLWANFDMEGAVGEDTDISFLAANLIDKAGLQKTAYQNFLLQLECALQENETSKKAQEMLSEYEILQYYFMFDYVNVK